MIRLQQLKMPIAHTEEQLRQKVASCLKIPADQIVQMERIRRSVDARKKSAVCYVYTLDVTVTKTARIPKKVYSNNVMFISKTEYRLPEHSGAQARPRPVIVGCGPAGLFCAYALSLAGCRPVVVERGKTVQERRQDVERFWRDGVLNPQSNVQFGEGGAGTFSDGKLNTLIKDEKGRGRMVLKTFVSFGAPEQILYDAKPHIGTDLLLVIVERMRKAIEQAGGSFLFETCLSGFCWEKDRLAGVLLRQGEKQQQLETDTAVLAIGHSARDTFALLKEQGFQMEAKSFAVGLRVEHPQQMIDDRQYGDAAKVLGAAPYKLSQQTKSGRGVYTFCMCPGGYVVNASSEPGMLAVNGMSMSQRDGANANSAVIVTVTQEDFGQSEDPSCGVRFQQQGDPLCGVRFQQQEDPLCGVRFQQQLEQKAFALGGGRIPQQLFGDFARQKESSGYGSFASAAKGATAFAPLHTLFAPALTQAFLEGMEGFERRIPGFARADCILSGVESRTSSPVRIVRNDAYLSNKNGVYPCGEGAGYAGGIMSAAIDGLKVAEAILANS